MDLDRLKTLIDAMAASDLAEMVVSEDGWTLRLVRGGSDRGEAAPLRPVEAGHPRPVAPRRTKEARSGGEVSAPMPGVVHLRPAPDRPDFVSAGSGVTSGTVVCLIEAMKTFLEVRAERGGVVEAILVASGEEVELGQTLMRIG